MNLFYEKSNKFLKYIYIFLLAFALVSCTSTTNTENREKPNISFNKINDYEIEILGTERANHVFFIILTSGRVGKFLQKR